jgi:hypothetical protein
MGHTVTWRCPWCGSQYASIDGTKFRLFRGKHKRRKCVACVKKELERENEQTDIPART